MTKFVYTTLTNDNVYTNYAPGPAGGVQQAAGQVLIYGGANRANKSLVTPLGVMTEVSDKDFEILQANADFQLHTKNGFITVRDDKVNAEVAAADMKGRDKSAPLTDNDYQEGDGLAKPSTKKK